MLNRNEAAVMTGYSRRDCWDCTDRGNCGDTKRGRNVSFRAGDLPKNPIGARQAIPLSSGAPPVDQETRANAKRLAGILAVRSESAGRNSTPALADPLCKRRLLRVNHICPQTRVTTSRTLEKNLDLVTTSLEDR